MFADDTLVHVSRSCEELEMKLNDIKHSWKLHEWK